MLDLKIERDDVNVELLDAQLRTIGGDLFYGLSAQRGGIILYVGEQASDALRKQLMQAVRQHDATQMTPEQQAAFERQTVIAQERSKPVLKVDDYSKGDALIQALAEKVAWLEQEVRDLRGL